MIVHECCWLHLSVFGAADLRSAVLGDVST
jgi:hypothetical protein